MSDEIEPGESGAEPATATALALAGASRAEADAFLRDQRHHLQEQLKQLSLKLWELRLGVLLRVATASTGLAITAGLAFLIWNAAGSNDLVIDAFAVPPDLAARGLSGPVVAAKLSDRIAAMQAETASARPAKSYANGLSDGLKLEIPETGVSLSELDRFLREQLGHDLHISGEVVQTDKELAFTARVGAEGSATVLGAQDDTDSLLQRLAEQVYRITQPYRYAVWLEGRGRYKEAIAIFKATAINGPAGERAWGYHGWGSVSQPLEKASTTLGLWLKAHALDPNFYLSVLNIAQLEERAGRMRDSRRDYDLAMALVQAHGRTYAQPQPVSNAMHNIRSTTLRYQGDLLEAAEQNRQAVAEGGSGQIFPFATNLASLHEPGRARAQLADAAIAPPYVGAAVLTAGNMLHARLTVAMEEQDWPGALSVDREMALFTGQFPGFADVRVTFFDPLVAAALAHMGQFVAAETRLKPMPADCYRCLIARAQVAALEGQDARADWWFARAVAADPEIPFAEEAWGRALLERHQADGAIEKFKIANRKGPHFADALEGWGEALMAQNRSDLTLAKFTEAEKYAPNWGRLHLKWGEALVWAGKSDDAKKQFARAGELDLSAAEKTELAKVRN